MNLETKWLEDFLALADSRNFSQAAHNRHVTQPAFGRRIRALEEAVGVELIDRATTPVGLTPAGRLFRATARSLLRQIDEGLGQLQGVAKGKQPIDFAAAHSLSVSLLPELIDAMSEKDGILHTRVESIDVDLAVEALQEGRSDFLLAFNLDALMQPPFLNVSLGKTKLQAVCAVDAEGKPLFSENDPTLPLLRYNPASFMGRKVNSVVQSLACNIAFDTVMESSLTNLLHIMALKGEGVAWLPDYAIKKELSDGRLVAVGPSNWWCDIEVMLYRNDIGLHPVAEAFWLSLSQRCERGWSLL